MRERPILFSAPMIRALLAGTKTQTRRVVKPRKDPDYGCELSPCEIAGDEHIARLCPYGAPGDRLWVKEQTLKVEDHGWIGPVYTESDAGRQALEWGYGESDDPDHIPPHAIKRRPSMFMSRAMSRITLEVTEVCVERLQDISEADALAEGIHKPAGSQFWHTDPGANILPGDTPQWAYRNLWESINGPGSWDANPWVWVVGFKLVEVTHG